MFFAEDLFAGNDPADPEDFARHLFPNSLVPEDTYRATLTNAGFELIAWDDMTEDWTAFTAERLEIFRANRPGYEMVHGPDGYRIIETFYAKMAGYFVDGSVGGVRFSARRRK